MLAEDRQERREFESEAKTLGGGRRGRLRLVARYLRTMYLMAPKGGSHRKWLAICSNVVADAAKHKRKPSGGSAGEDNG